jgi:hypothetical protein
MVFLFYDPYDYTELSPNVQSAGILLNTPHPPALRCPVTPGLRNLQGLEDRQLFGGKLLGLAGEFSQVLFRAVETAL